MAKSAYDNIEEIVRTSLSFNTGQNNNGWNKIYCEVCGDGKRTKGPRGGWRFDGDFCAYHCFNCGIDGNFDPTREIAYSTNMPKIFSAFGIPQDEIKTLIFSKKINRNFQVTKPAHQKMELKYLDIPDHFYPLATADVDNVVANKARDYLKKRHVDPNSYPFYLSTGISSSDDPGDISNTKYLRDRIIVPSMYKGKMVYYFARSLDPDSKMPYLNANVPRGNIIYGFDKLYTKPKNILFITEGFFDAYHLDGVSVLENHITKEQAEILDKSPRQKVIVPDNKGYVGGQANRDDSDRLIEKAAEMEWGISIPDIGDCKDITAAINKYGKLYVLDSVMKNIKTGRRAINWELSQRLKKSGKGSKKV